MSFFRDDLDDPESIPVTPSRTWRGKVDITNLVKVYEVCVGDEVTVCEMNDEYVILTHSAKEGSKPWGYAQGNCRVMKLGSPLPVIPSKSSKKDLFKFEGYPTPEEIERTIKSVLRKGFIVALSCNYNGYLCPVNIGIEERGD